MRSIHFDTLEFMEEIKSSGFTIEQAEAITKATRSALNNSFNAHDLATKDDVRQIEIKLIKAITESMWKIIGIIGTLQTIMITGIGFITYFR